MQTLIEALREIVGTPDFYIQGTDPVNYGAMFEYFGALVLVLVVVSSVFKLIVHWASGK